MRFDCVECRHTHRAISGPANPTARLVVVRWHQDPQGLDHYAAACLECGAIHDVVPSAKALIGRPWRTVNHLNARLIIEAHRRSGYDGPLQDFARSEAGLPERIINELVFVGIFPEI